MPGDFNFNSINPFMHILLGATLDDATKDKMILDMIEKTFKSLVDEINQSSSDLFSIHSNALDIQISNFNKQLADGADNTTLKNMFETVKENFAYYKSVKEDLKDSTSYEKSKAIINMLNLPNLHITECIALCYEMLDLEQGVSLVAQVIANQFHRLKMDRMSASQRFALIVKMSNGGAESAPALIKFLCMTGLRDITLEQRLKLFPILIVNGAASELVRYFSLLEMENASTVEHFKLCLMIAEEGVDAQGSLIFSLDNFNLDIDQRLTLYQKLIGLKCSLYLIHVIEKLQLEKISGDQRLALYTALIDHPSSAEMLAAKLDVLLLENASYQQRFDLCMAILDSSLQISNSTASAISIIDNYSLLGLKNISIEKRLALIEKMAELGDKAVKALMSNFELFCLSEATPTQRYVLFSRLLSHDRVSMKDVLANIHKFELDKAEYHLLVKLLNKTINQGLFGKDNVLSRMIYLRKFTTSGQRLEIAKKYLNFESCSDDFFGSFHTFFLDNTDVLLFMRYAVLKGKQDKFLNRKFFNSFIDPALRRQILIDLLSPPSGLTESPQSLIYYGSFLSAFEAFIPGKDPIITILNKKPKELKQEDIQKFKTFLTSHPKLRLVQDLVTKIEMETEATIKKNVEMDRQKPIQKGPEKIREEGEFTKHELITWSAYAAGILFDQDETYIEAIADTKLLDLICSYSYPSLRYTLIRAFSELNSSEVTGFYQNVTGSALAEALQTTPIPLTQLQKPAYLFSSLTEFGLSPQKRSALLEQILNTRSMKQIAVSSTLAKLLLAVISQGPYETEEADKIADCVIKALKQPEIRGKTKKKPASNEKEDDDKINKEKQVVTKEEETKKDLNALINIIQIFGKNDLIEFVSPANDKASAVQFFQNSFRNIFKVEEMPDFETRYEETFGKFSDPMALFSYYQGINRLLPEIKNVVLETLNVYVNSVLRGNFQEVRANPANSAHLQRIYTARPDLQEKWNKSFEPAPIVLNEAEIKEGGEKPVTRFQFVETVDPADLLFIGELKKSCQTIHGEPKHNQALVSYMMNGEIRAFAVKNGDKIVARLLLRLLWDEKNQCPVLLQEPYYTNLDIKDFTIIITHFVTEKAKLMGLNIITTIESHQFVPYPGTVEFLGGFAPVGYCDSAGGIIPYVKPPETSEEHDKTGVENISQPPANAAFKVPNPRLLYSLTQKHA